MTRPVHLPTCRCGGTGLIETSWLIPSNGTAPAQAYRALNECPDGPPITADHWAEWQTRQIAGGHRTIRNGILNPDQAPAHIAAARAHLEDQ